MLQIGEAVFARFSDGYYYWATIDAIDEAGIHVIYFDNYRDTLAPDLVISIDAGLQGMRLEANWENRGRYYDCTLDGFEPENGLFKVTYSQDGVQELIPAWQFRFKELLPAK